MGRRDLVRAMAAVLAVPWAGSPAVKAAQQPIEQLAAAFQADRYYAYVWHCNLACAAMDEGLELQAANRAAARVMQAAFGVDTSNY